MDLEPRAAGAFDRADHGYAPRFRALGLAGAGFDGRGVKPASTAAASQQRWDPLRERPADVPGGAAAEAGATDDEVIHALIYE